MVMLLAGSLGAWQESLTREGSYWVQTVTGTVATPPSGKLRISTRGKVAAAGGPEQVIRYSFVKRVKARNEAEARRRLGKFVIRSSRAGDWGVLSVAHESETSIQSELQVKAPRGLRDMIVETHGGSVTAVDLAGNLQAQTGGGPIHVDKLGRDVVAITAGGEIVLGSIGGSAICKSAGGPIRAASIRGEARLSTAGGDIVALEVGGNVHASTAGGSIQIAKAGGMVAVNTAGGKIDIGSARGMVTAESMGGPIEVGSAIGVLCESGGGAIRLTNVTGSLRASTAVGNIIAQLLAGAAIADSSLSTGQGDITVYVPSNLRITIQAQNESAQSLRRIVSDFPALRVRRDGPVVVAEGDLNGGGPLLRLSSAGGTIYIKRQP
ncbi:MAG: hypothetical protein ACRD8O_18445 [Bryobacteraceae bacterium]